MTALKPSALKILEGTYRRDRANGAEPRPALGAKPPPWLPRRGPARQAWRRLARVLTRTRVLTEADGEALGLVCLALAEFLEARVDPAGWRHADAAWKRYAAGLGWFGLNPTARVRVAAQPAPERDPMAEWMAQPTGTPPPATPRPKRSRPARPPADPIEAWQRDVSSEEPA